VIGQSDSWGEQVIGRSDSWGEQVIGRSDSWGEQILGQSDPDSDYTCIATNVHLKKYFYHTRLL